LAAAPDRRLSRDGRSRHGDQSGRAGAGSDRTRCARPAPIECAECPEQKHTDCYCWVDAGLRLCGHRHAGSGQAALAAMSGQAVKELRRLRWSRPTAGGSGCAGKGNPTTAFSTRLLQACSVYFSFCARPLERARWPSVVVMRRGRHWRGWRGALSLRKDNGHGRGCDGWCCCCCCCCCCYCCRCRWCCC